MENLFEISACPNQELLGKLNSSTEGLDEAEVNIRLAKFGTNELKEQNKNLALDVLIHSVANPFVFILAIISAIGFQVGDLKSVFFTLLMSVMSIVINFYQEYKSTRSIEKLRNLFKHRVKVVRRNQSGQTNVMTILSSNIVVGDILLLNNGDIIPADLRLIESCDLVVSQSVISGESFPVEKSCQYAATEDIFSLNNICFAGSSIVSGFARGLVVKVAGDTQINKIKLALTGLKNETNFEKGIKDISKLLIKIVLIVTPLIFVINFFLGKSLTESFMFAIAVAVSLIPELLPMVVTANLAFGASAMVKHKVIVKQLGAIHNFGSMEVLCTDKTGTLTQDKIILQDYLNTQGLHDKDIKFLSFIASFHQTSVGVLERAILQDLKEDEANFANQAKSWTKILEIPFDFSRRRNAMVFELASKKTIIVKGAIEEVLNCCSTIKDQSLMALTPENKEKIRQKEINLSYQGFRVLALATKDLASDFVLAKEGIEKDLTFLGFITFLDPPKDSAFEAIESLKKLGVEVKVITGDNAIVTKKICNDLQIFADNAINGYELSNLTETEFDHAVLTNNIFAKINPEQKAKIIQSLRKNGKVVGFLGDGVNDSMALRAADVGISVDTGADVAKEAADIVLLEKNLMVLPEGIKTDRKIYFNIIKYIKMALSSNLGNALSFIFTSITLPFLPMKPLQILIANLIYDFSQLSLPTDGVDPDDLVKPHKWEKSDLLRFMFILGPISSLFDLLMFFMLRFFFLADERLFQTCWFCFGVISQSLIIYVIRTKKNSFLQETVSHYLVFTTFIVIGTVLYLPFSLFADTLGFVPLSGSVVLAMFFNFMLYFVITGLLKRVYYEHFKKWL